MNWPALAAAIGGAAVGVAGVLFGWLNSKGERENSSRLAKAEREHQLRLARDARLFDELRTAYDNLVEFLLVMGEVVERTHPDYGPTLDPPPRPPDEELRSMLARVSIIGAEDVMEAVDELARSWTAFLSWSEAVDALEAQRAYDQVPESRRQMLEARQAFRGQLAEVQRLIRVELRR